MPELSRIILERLGAYPHGLVTFNRLQNITNSFFNLERLVVTEKNGDHLKKLFIINY